MSSARAAGIIKHAADERTVAVLEAQGRQESLKDLETTGPGSARDVGHAFAASSVMVAGLAELVGDLARQGQADRDEIAELKEEIAELKATKPAAKSKAKKV